MKVTVWGINYAPELTGIAPYNRALCEFLHREGHTVRMVTSFAYYPAWKKSPEDFGRLYRDDDVNGVPVHRCWHYVPRRPGTLKRILHEASFVACSWLRLLFLPRPDVFVVVSPPLLLGAAAWLLTRLKRAPFVFHVQDLQPDAALGLRMLRPGLFMRLLFALEQFAYARAARVSAISRGMLEAMTKKGVPAAKQIYFPNGVAVSAEHPERGRFRARAGFRADDLLAVYSGNLGAKQGLEILAEAAALAGNQRLQIVICGDGAMRPQLAARIAGLNLSNVRLLDLQSEPHYLEMLVDADVTLVTQQAGSGAFFFPSKLLRSLALGKPVLTVADESSELARALAENRFGVNVQPGRPKELAAALKALSDAPERLREFGANGLRFVAQFEQDRVLRDFEAHLRALVAASGKRVDRRSPGGSLRDHVAGPVISPVAQQGGATAPRGWQSLQRGDSDDVSRRDGGGPGAVSGGGGNGVGTMNSIAKYFPPLALALVWLQLFNQLRPDWAMNPQYAFGFIVPPLALALFWRRWQLRPAPEAATGHAALLAAGALLAWVLPIRVVEEANPEWRLMLWAHALVLAGFSLALLQHAGGAAWRRHFAFPVGFLLVSVPWPMGFEQAVIQNLMRGVAGITVELAGLAGITALQQGNLIEIGAGLVGVDEACSGVRSLQTTLMTALFLGELYFFNTWRRVALVAAGIVIAVPANVARTFFLVWIAAEHGFEALHRAHDGAGMVVIAMVLPALFGAAAWLRRGWKPAFEGSVESAPQPRPLGLQWAFVFLGVAALAEVGTELWYRSHERTAVANARWSIAWPTQQTEFAEITIGDTARGILRCDEGRGVSWADARANRWRLFFLRWEPGKNSAQLAKGHTPDICLPGTGHRLRTEHAVARVRVRELELAFRHYEFDSGGRTLFVFYCLWEDRVSAATGRDEDGTMGSRWAAVRAGRRNLGQQVLEIAVEGPATPEESLVRLREELGKLISP